MKNKTVAVVLDSDVASQSPEICEFLAAISDNRPSQADQRAIEVWLAFRLSLEKILRLSLESISTGAAIYFSP